MPNLKAPELIVILLVVLLLFGAKRLPDLAKGVGKSLRIFKEEVRDNGDDARTPPVATRPDRPATDAPSSAAPAAPFRDPVTRTQDADDTERKQV
ncbi:Sec-independent protein translocase subunit TatA [Pengzhenrongella sp.]|uniref:Sec-independent protein translocase subunit TatA n=1 Tax=Pengzhenrongella sp. TaxID=2888820 RepID=UPI002F943DE2